MVDAISVILLRFRGSSSEPRPRFLEPTNSN